MKRVMITHIEGPCNGHRTLIIVIAVVLLIFFLYWIFCSKDKPLGNKVKGGTFANACDIVIQGEKYKGVGLCVEGEHLIPVLNKKGIDLLDSEFKVTLEMFDTYFSDDSIYMIFGDPVGLFAGVDENTSTVFGLLNIDQYKKFLNQRTFNFYDIIGDSSLTEDQKKDVIDSYNSLCCKITEFNPHIAFAAGIFQLNSKLPNFPKDTLRFFSENKIHIIISEYHFY